MGSVPKVRMKPGCIPIKFACQPDRESIEGPYYTCRKKKMMALEECEKQSEENSMVTEHNDLEELRSGKKILIKLN